MRQGLAFILIIMLLGVTFPGKEVQSEDEHYQTIPDDAIRLRILANSDSKTDQEIKHRVRDEVNQYITNLVEHIASIEEAREMIRKQIPEIDKIIATTLEQKGVEENFQVEYRSNVSFPTKVYDHYVYPAGEYEAVLITIGEGKGANWWCVLFPPLCFLDFSNGATVDDEEMPVNEKSSLNEDVEASDSVNDSPDKEDEVEVSFFLLEWLGLS